MPTYKVSFPSLTIEAPTAQAARLYYWLDAVEAWDSRDISAVEVTGEPADCTVDIAGYEIEQVEE